MSEGWYIFSAVLKFVGVILLIFGCAIAVRRWPSLVQRQARKRSVVLVETLRLSPRQALHLIKTGESYLLVGATDQGIQLVSTVALPEEQPMEQTAAVEQPSLDFSSVMAAMLHTLQPEKVSAAVKHLKDVK